MMSGTPVAVAGDNGEVLVQYVAASEQENIDPQQQRVCDQRDVQCKRRGFGGFF